MPIESIAQLVGHAGTRVLEAVCHKELRLVVTVGAEVTGSIFTRKPYGGRPR